MLGLGEAHDLLRIRVRVLPHRLSEAEEDSEGDGHEKIVSSKVERN